MKRIETISIFFQDPDLRRNEVARTHVRSSSSSTATATSGAAVTFTTDLSLPPSDRSSSSPSIIGSEFLVSRTKILALFKTKMLITNSFFRHLPFLHAFPALHCIFKVLILVSEIKVIHCKKTTPNS